MDLFDIDALDFQIKEYKKEIISKLHQEKVTQKNMKNSSDLICQVLDFSPKTKSIVTVSKIELKNNNNNLPDFVQKYPSNLSLDLASRQIDEDDKESLSERESEDRSNSKSRKSSSFYNEKTFYIKQIVFSIIESSVLKAEKIEEDDDDDYELLLLKRQSESKLSKHTHKSNHKEIHSHYHTKTSISKISNQFNETLKLKIYLFGTAATIDIDIMPGDTYHDLKVKIINFLLSSSEEYQMKYKVPEAFEIRLIDEDDEAPNMDVAAMEDTMNVTQSKNSIFAFVARKEYDPNDSKLQKKNSNVAQEGKVNIKVHFKTKKYSTLVKVIVMSEENTLKDLLEYIISRDLLLNRNSDLYYFVEHSADSDDDMDNAINNDIIVKYLSTLELDLYYKKFPDVPESIKYSQFSQRDSDKSSDFNLSSKNMKEEENGKEYFFNDISAGLYQEFEVFKVTKYKSKQERILGIDLYNLYNNLPKNKQNAKGILNFFLPRTKNPLRKIKDIKECDILDSKMFYITMKENEGEEKKIIYEVKNNNIRNEIIAKLKFLIVSINIYNTYRN